MNDFKLSETLLADLYQSAVTEDSGRFQQSVLQQLEAVIGFDRAWWGIMRQTGTGFELLSSYRYELPAEFELHWQAVSSDDALASNVHIKPRTTVHFNQRELLSTPGLASLNTEHKLRQALCTSMFLPDQQSFLFISLFRSGTKAPVFNAKDIEFKQLVTPHLYACWRTNLVATIARTQGPGQQTATAFVDRSGAIVCAHDGFADMVSEVYPAWDGGRTLPLQMLANECIARALPGFQMAKTAVGGLLRLDIYKPSALARLTQRESQIARAYAQARSHKQIALDMQLTPATVRYYIQTIYEKLNLHNKAELVKLVETDRQSLALSSLVQHPHLARDTSHTRGPGQKVIDYLMH